MPKVESFSPELFEIWRKAPISFVIADGAAATSLRFRLYSLRTALGNSDMDEHKALYRHAARLKISKTRRYDSLAKRHVYDVKIYDADSQYKDVLNQIGVTAPEPPDLDL